MKRVHFIKLGSSTTVTPLRAYYINVPCDQNTAIFGSFCVRVLYHKLLTEGQLTVQNSTSLMVCLSDIDHTSGVHT